MEYGRHVMEAELTKDDDYVVARDRRKEESDYWRVKAARYVEDLDKMDEHVCKLTARVKELEREIEDT